MRYLYAATLALFLGQTLAHSSHAQSDQYELSLTRRDSNLYEDSGGQIFIQTRYCYAYVYYSSAILNWSGIAGEVIFLDNRDRCDVERVLSESSTRPGKYSVTITLEDDNLYALNFGKIFILTKRCRARARSENAVLNWDGRRGEIIFLDQDARCEVEKVLAPAT